MTGRLEMSCKLLPFRESHDSRLTNGELFEPRPPLFPHNETRASKPGCTVGANLHKAVHHLSIQLGHIKGDKSTSSSHGQLAARRVSSGGGKRSRWGSTEVAKNPHYQKTAAVFFPSRFCVARLKFNASPNTPPMIPSAAPSGLSPRDLSLLQTVPSRMCSEVPRRYLGCVTYGVAFEGVSPADPRGKVCHICVGAGARRT
jgi:hypothetical protein